jgi:hypothetical protein
MGAIGVVLAGIVILVLALVFGWAFFVLVVGLAIGLVAIIGIIFIAIIIAAAIGLIRAVTK